MSMTYKGDVQIVERDDAAKTATLRAKAKESRGQGTADAHVHMALAEEGDGTHATLETDVALGGRVAAMGRGVIADVSARLVQTFAGNLAEMLGGRHGRGVVQRRGRRGPRARDGRRRGECLRARGDRRPGDGRAAGVRPDARAPSRARPRRRTRVCRWASSSRASSPAACRIRRRSSPGRGSLR